jgi:Flp pilus assembly protein TadG
MKRTKLSQKGASLVEFALILSLLLVLTFGMIEFGIFIYNKQVITNASREGARAGIVARTPRLPITGTDSITSVVTDYVKDNIQNKPLLVTFGTQNTPLVNVTGYSAAAPFGSDLQVEVTYQYAFLVVPNFIPGINKTATLRATTVMRYE